MGVPNNPLGECNSVCHHSRQNLKYKWLFHLLVRNSLTLAQRCANHPWAHWCYWFNSLLNLSKNFF